MNNECSLTKEGILSDLRQGLLVEKSAYENYLKIAPQIVDEESRKIIEHIASEEAMHIKMVEELIMITEVNYTSSTRS